MHSKNKSRVFITGASGFVGANIVRHLLREHYDVHILQRTSQPSWRLKDISKLITTHKGDITNYKSLKGILEKIQPHSIIHLAAYGAYHYQVELDKIINVNIEGTRNLLEASKDIPYTCFINTGSSSEYGFKNEPMKEQDYCDPTSYYAATKLAQTHLCKIFSVQNNKPIITFRLFSVYGEYEQPGRLIPAIMTATINKKPINLSVGKQRRDFIYIDDVAHAYILGMKFRGKHNGQVFNIGTGVEKSNDEIVKELFAVTGLKTQINKGFYPKRTWDTKHWVADISKSKKLLHWQPKYTTQQGLKTSYNWYRKHLNLYNS